MSIVPFIFWAATVVIGFIIYLIVAKRIEASGLARLGATGNIWTVDPHPAKLAAEEKEIEDLLNS